MVKKLFLTLVVVIFLLAPATALGGFFGGMVCELGDGSDVYIWIPQAGQFSQLQEVPGDQKVVIVEDQPTAQQLKQFGDHPTVNKDWSDGIIIYDEDDNVTALVHKKDLDCSSKK